MIFPSQRFGLKVPDFRQLKRHEDDIAWETEVWLAEISNHLNYFNGDKLFGPKGSSV